MPTDILCVVPPYSYKGLKDVGPKCPNLGISSIAAFLEQNGYTVKIHDAFALDSTFRQIEDEVRKEKPAVVLTGSSTSTHVAASKILEIAKQVDSSAVTIYGGPHVTNLPESALAKPYVDYVVKGEGELTALELVNYATGKADTDRKNILGIAYVGNGSMVTTAPRPFIKNLDDLPMPAYHLLPMDKYQAYGWLDVGRRFTTMITSRGCPFRCSFCVSSKNFAHWWRARSAEKVFEEIQLLYDKYGVRHIYFQDDEFAVDHKRVKKLADLIVANNLDLYWECLCRVNHVDEDLVKDMARSGCKSVLYGVEVGYEEGFKKINKPITLDMTYDAVKLTQKHGIMVKATFIMGFPWEGEKELRQTIKFAKKLDADLTFFNTLTPYPGTYLYNEIVEGGYLVGSDDWELHATHGTMPLVKTKYLSEKELSYWIGRAYLSMYLRPKYIWRKLKSMRNFQEFKRNFKSGIELMTLAARKVLKGRASSAN